MKHVVIMKKYSEIERTKENAHMPDEWPAECQEFDSLDAAQAAHPELFSKGRIMPIEHYHLFSRGLQLAHEHLRPKRAWKIWGKK